MLVAMMGGKRTQMCLLKVSSRLKSITTVIHVRMLSAHLVQKNTVGVSQSLVNCFIFNNHLL